MWPRYTTREVHHAKTINGAYFPTILGLGAPSFKN